MNHSMAPRAQDIRSRYARAGRACGLVAALVIAGAAPADPAGDGAESVLVEIPKTTLSIELVPVDIGDGRTLLVARREISWDHYDTFIYGLDQQDPAKPDDADVVTRPTKPYINMDRGWGHTNFPAMGMSHLAAQEFCGWLGHKTGRKFRLPTEEEWQAIADRAGTTPDKVDARCWHADNTEDTTRESATKDPDDLGLYDLLGNVGEWCTDAEGKAIVRGGSYLDEPDMLTAQARQKPHRSWNATDPQIPKSKWWLADCTWVGIRVVCEPDAAPAEPAE
ncbi:MAG TPA: SUMF1/EgtB/PvdO family nonheme iron enzyme [Phycisphaerales bacterium]|nr:SUMF1/EgtB/PvdO family nonheme iron enzyme [Phycisphaerales bacterium]